MKVGILGSGDVAKSLAKGFIKHGHQVAFGTRDTGKLSEFIAAHPTAKALSANDAADFGDLLVLSVKGDVAETVLAGVQHQLSGKVVIDTTNPISDAPPVKGVLQFFTGPNDSLGERLQARFPQARIVKAFNSVGSGLMVDPQFADGKPTMFVAGNDTAAKADVGEILNQFGWEVADMGAIEASRALEPLCQLWCIPGFINNQWSHAFRLLK
ncbi:DNA-binding protein [Cellvibrio zantedeschiae]|uniref:DNA-binding protein n=1 Tax=Cellvibrio zantedeschiae TaxID=1237077 RepID=A0ABQ3B412_9GAMM|nr:NAD(P)-binding domain-containing protein [Cellvibrio zantedeschiae]GGY78712.1 DNA-binding protein [Cellvibrio zantedeschiae]